MRRGELFLGDAALSAELDRRQLEVQRINAIPGARAEERRAALEAFLGHFGEGTVIRPPFYCDFGDGISIGARTFIYSCRTMLDTAPITVGDECHIAANVQLVGATHPIDPGPRRAGWEYARPVAVADGVWLGAGVIVLPGVSVGENTVVGAGSVVTRDLPATSLPTATRPAWPARLAPRTGSSCRAPAESLRPAGFPTRPTN